MSAKLLSKFNFKQKFISITLIVAFIFQFICPYDIFSSILKKAEAIADEPASFSAIAIHTLTADNVDGVTIYVSGAFVERQKNTDGSFNNVYKIQEGSTVRVSAVNESKKFNKWNFTVTTVTPTSTLTPTCEFEMPAGDVSVSCNTTSPSTDEKGTYFNNAYELSSAEHFNALERIIIAQGDVDSDYEKFGFTKKTTDARAALLKGYFKITASFSLDSTYSGLGRADTSFNGLIDGQNFTTTLKTNINDLKVSTSGQGCSFGLIGGITASDVNETAKTPTTPALIRNLDLVGSIQVSSAENEAVDVFAGSIAGRLGIGTLVKNCKSNVRMSVTTKGNCCVGGMFGLLRSGVDTDVQAVYDANYSVIKAKSTGTDKNVYVGGLIGASQNVYVKSLNFDMSGGNILAEGNSTTYAGGILGCFITEPIPTATTTARFDSGVMPDPADTIVYDCSVNAKKLGFDLSVTGDKNIVAAGGLAGGLICDEETTVPFKTYIGYNKVYEDENYSSPIRITAQDKDANSEAVISSGGLIGTVVNGVNAIQIVGQYKDTDKKFSGNVIVSAIQKGKGNCAAGGIYGVGSMASSGNENEHAKVNLGAIKVLAKQMASATGTGYCCAGGITSGLTEGKITSEYFDVYGDGVNIQALREEGCKAQGNIYVGGVVGWIDNPETLALLYSNLIVSFTGESIIQGNSLSYDSEYSATGNNLYVGGIVGYGKNMTISNCNFTGYTGKLETGTTASITSKQNARGAKDDQSDSFSGGIAGVLEYATVENTTYNGSEGDEDKVSHLSNNNGNTSCCGGILGKGLSDGTKEVTIENCTVKNTDISINGYTDDNSPDFDIYAAGIAGALTFNGKINKCYSLDNKIMSQGKESVKSRTAGILGSYWKFSDKGVFITNCVSKGNVIKSLSQSGDSNAGGITSYQHKRTTIQNCASIDDQIIAQSVLEGDTGSIAGGIIGYAAGFNLATIKNCYSNARLSVMNQGNNISKGGVIGYSGTSTSGDISNVFFHQQNAGTEFAVGPKKNWAGCTPLDFSTINLSTGGTETVMRGTTSPSTPNLGNLSSKATIASDGTGLVMAATTTIVTPGYSNGWQVTGNSAGIQLMQVWIKPFDKVAGTGSADDCYLLGEFNVIVDTGSGDTLTLIDPNNVEVGEDKTYDYTYNYPDDIIFKTNTAVSWTLSKDSPLASVTTTSTSITIKPNVPITSEETFTFSATNGGHITPTVTINISPEYVKSISFTSAENYIDTGEGEPFSGGPGTSEDNPLYVITGSTIKLNATVVPNNATNTLYRCAGDVSTDGGINWSSDTTYIKSDGRITGATTNGNLFRVKATSVGAKSNGNLAISDYAYVKVVGSVNVTTELTGAIFNGKTQAGAPNSSTTILGLNYKFSIEPQVGYGGTPTVMYYIGASTEGKEATKTGDYYYVPGSDITTEDIKITVTYDPIFILAFNPQDSSVLVSEQNISRVDVPPVKGSYNIYTKNKDPRIPPAEAVNGYTFRGWYMSKKDTLLTGYNVGELFNKEDIDATDTKSKKVDYSVAYYGRWTYNIKTSLTGLTLIPEPSGGIELQDQDSIVVGESLPQVPIHSFSDYTFTIEKDEDEYVGDFPTISISGLGEISPTKDTEKSDTSRKFIVKAADLARAISVEATEEKPWITISSGTDGLKILPGEVTSSDLDTKIPQDGIFTAVFTSNQKKGSDDDSSTYAYKSANSETGKNLTFNFTNFGGEKKGLPEGTKFRLYEKVIKTGGSPVNTAWYYNPTVPSEDSITSVSMINFKKMGQTGGYNVPNFSSFTNGTTSYTESIYLVVIPPNGSTGIAEGAKSVTASYLSDFTSNASMQVITARTTNISGSIGNDPSGNSWDSETFNYTDTIPTIEGISNYLEYDIRHQNRYFGISVYRKKENEKENENENEIVSWPKDTTITATLGNVELTAVPVSLIPSRAQLVPDNSAQKVYFSLPNQTTGNLSVSISGVTFNTGEKIYIDLLEDQNAVKLASGEVRNGLVTGTQPIP